MNIIPSEGHVDFLLASLYMISPLLFRLVAKRFSFPAISAGVFGFPIQRCAEIMLKTTIDYLKGQTALEKVTFCLFGQANYELFEDQLKQETSK